MEQSWKQKEYIPSTCFDGVILIEPSVNQTEPSLRGACTTPSRIQAEHVPNGAEREPN